MEIRKLEQMFEVLRSKPKKRLVAAYANDDHTICAVNAAAWPTSASSTSPLM